METVHMYGKAAINNEKKGYLAYASCCLLFVQVRPLQSQRPLQAARLAWKA